MANFLGIDYGRKYLGLALATTPLAEPVAFWENNETVLPRLKKISQKHQVDTIVIGISEGAMAEETKTFAQKVKQVCQQPVIFHDETLTSHEASLKLRHAKRSKRGRPQDAFQAALMLQDYLDTHKP